MTRQVSHRCASVLIGFCAVGVGSVLAHPVFAESRSPSTTEFLYQMAEEHRQAGRIDDAIHELRKLLLVDPHNEQARRELAMLEAVQQGASPAMEPASREQEPVATPIAGARTAVASGALRIPDPRMNGIEWFYVFGPKGKATYGAEAEPQVIFLEVPRTRGGSVVIRVLDADIRGRHDERDGVWDTSTVFRVFAGSQQPVTRTIGPDAPDGTTIEFGPFALDQGTAEGDHVLFRIEAEGVAGDDNNLFALEVMPADAQGFSYHPAIRLASRQGDEMRFFPEVPAGTTRIQEENYDLDSDGGAVYLASPSDRNTVRLKSSGSGASASTVVPVRPGTAGARWVYRIVKATEPNGNMSFRLQDQNEQPLRVYFSPGVETPVPPVPVAALPRQTLACNAFEFDASGSYDPDKQSLTFLWDFGDGATAEGVRAQHTYAQAGDYKVVLKVKDSTSTECCQAETQQLLHVNTPPTAVLEAPVKACLGGPVHLSAARSTDTPGDQLSYAWDLGDGTAAQGAEVTHQYARGGAYRVRLVVNDGRGTSCSTDTVSHTLRVNSPPTAQVSGPINVCSRDPHERLTATFNAAGSKDPDGDPLSYRWDFGDGTAGEGASVAHAYANGGRYTARLTVDDGSGTECALGTTTVTAQLNHAPVVLPGPSVDACIGSAVHLDAAAASSDPDGDPLVYRWDFGDGQTGTGAKTEHRYDTSGTHRARVTVDDGSGMACAISSATWNVVVNTPPVPKITIRGADGTASTGPVESNP